jgi:hypothetical protein
MSESLAVWFEDRQGYHPSLDVHFNLWKLSEDLCFLDVGVMLSNVRGQYMLFFYFPFDVSSGNLFDLSGKLKDEEVLPAVFNAPFCLNDNYPGVDGFGVADAISRKFVCREDVEKNLEYKRVVGLDGIGTRLKIQLDDLSVKHQNFACYPAQYVRFRIILNADAAKQMVVNIKPKDRFLLSSFVSVDVVDFRVNEIRNLPREIEQDLQNNKLISTCMRRILYFLILDSNSEFEVANNNFTRCRILEDRLWRKYLSHEKYKKDIDAFLRATTLIYQWKEAFNQVNSDGKSFKSFEDYNSLVKTRQLRSGWKNIIFFTAVVVFFGALGSLLASGFQLFFPWLFSRLF